MTFQSDFDFVHDLLCKFSENRNIQKSLSTIKKCNIRGWEKWLQIEFALFLENHENCPNWKRETRYSLDRRSSKTANQAYADFCIRKKYSSINHYIAIEFKAMNRWSDCLRGMMVDWAKIEKIKSSCDNIRALWVVGFHLTTHRGKTRSDIELQNLFKNAIENKHQISIPNTRLRTFLIGKTGFAFTVF